jgi:hypothetical protein
MVGTVRSMDLGREVFANAWPRSCDLIVARKVFGPQPLRGCCLLGRAGFDALPPLGDTRLAVPHG